MFFAKRISLLWLIGLCFVMDVHNGPADERVLSAYEETREDADFVVSDLAETDKEDNHLEESSCDEELLSNVDPLQEAVDLLAKRKTSAMRDFRNFLRGGALTVETYCALIMLARSINIGWNQNKTSMDVKESLFHLFLGICLIHLAAKTTLEQEPFANPDSSWFKRKKRALVFAIPGSLVPLPFIVSHFVSSCQSHAL